MPERSDVFDAFEPIIQQRPDENPWQLDQAGRPYFHPDYELLEALVAIPVSEQRGAESGRLANAIDAWVAHELRRSGFPADEVWPRLTRPRVVAREVSLFINRLPKTLRPALEDRLRRDTAVGRAAADILGKAYIKQVDVVMSQWARGPEILISTKSMMSSFRNNLPNRFEEAYGDAHNLRGRHPLASIGYLFVLRSTILDEPGSLERAIDMVRKLREPEGYDATAIVVLDWDSASFHGVIVVHDVVPPDLDAEAFLATTIDRVLERTPVQLHVEARQRRDHRDLPLEDPDV